MHKFSWLIEWKEWNEETESYDLECDTWHKWDDVVSIFNDCISDELCKGATVYCFLDGEPYNGTGTDNIVLKYCP